MIEPGHLVLTGVVTSGATVGLMRIIFGNMRKDVEKKVDEKFCDERHEMLNKAVNDIKSSAGSQIEKLNSMNNKVTEILGEIKRLNGS